jgi:hypothetical protein
MIAIEPSDPQDFAALLDAKAYTALVQEQQ